MGLRYELPTPLTERFNRSVADYDEKGASPIVNQVMANYAQNPIPQVSPSQFNVLGGLTFLGVGGVSRNLWNYSRSSSCHASAWHTALLPKQ